MFAPNPIPLVSPTDVNKDELVAFLLLHLACLLVIEAKLASLDGHIRHELHHL